MVKIARALPASRLQALDVSHNDIGERGARELAAVLNDTALQSLDIGMHDCAAFALTCARVTCIALVQDGTLYRAASRTSSPHCKATHCSPT